MLVYFVPLLPPWALIFSLVLNESVIELATVSTASTADSSLHYGRKMPNFFK